VKDVSQRDQDCEAPHQSIMWSGIQLCCMCTYLTGTQVCMVIECHLFAAAAPFVLGQRANRACTLSQGTQIGEPFFKALERVCSIHANCRSLLRTQHQRAGLELMDLMSSYQETAYEHLCRSSFSFPI